VFLLSLGRFVSLIGSAFRFSFSWTNCWHGGYGHNCCIPCLYFAKPMGESMAGHNVVKALNHCLSGAFDCLRLTEMFWIGIYYSLVGILTFCVTLRAASSGLVLGINLLYNF
jgi:hypothetical protein